MTYNVHPLFVHFPIALLFLYSLIKILPLPKWFPKVSWKHIEVALLLVGVLGALAALYTGGIAEHLVGSSNKQLIEIHSSFAEAASVIYGLFLLGEVLTFFNISFLSLQKILTNPWVSKTLAFLGLVAITVTGLLGGVIVYGLTADPIAPLVLRLLGLNY